MHCDLKAKMDGEFLMFEFLEQPQMGSYASEYHNINIANVNKEDVNNIDLDFENCESFFVYHDEIKELNLIFDNKLEWGAEDLNRKVVGGYIRIKLNKNFYSRENSLIDNYKRLNIQNFEKRLCGIKGESGHDICHLYINYYHAGYGGIQVTECIEIDDINFDNETANDIEEIDDYIFESGYCKKMNDGTIVVGFGQNAHNTIEELSKNN